MIKKQWFPSVFPVLLRWKVMCLPLPRRRARVVVK
ncbi:trans-sialidase, putative, partial [Trypanosoma cruzi]